MSETKMMELQLDIAELKALQEKATRSRVRDVISVQVRKMETELVDIKDKIKATGKEAQKPSENIKRVMECQLKDYCNITCKCFLSSYFNRYFSLGPE